MPRATDFGATVTLTSADTGDHFGTVSGTTNAAGVFTTTLSSTQANAADTVTALINGTASETASGRLHGWRSIADDLVADCMPGTVTADGTTTTTLTVTAKDAKGNVIPVRDGDADVGGYRGSFWHGVWHHQCGGRVHDDVEFDPGERSRHRDGTDQRHGERDRQRRFHGGRGIADDLVAGCFSVDGERRTGRRRRC